jgi:hypothetical protein
MKYTVRAIRHTSVEESRLIHIKSVVSGIPFFFKCRLYFPPFSSLLLLNLRLRLNHANEHFFRSRSANANRGTIRQMQ